MDLRFTLMLDCIDRFAESMRDFKQALSTACGSGIVEKVRMPDQPSDTISDDANDDRDRTTDMEPEPESQSDSDSRREEKIDQEADTAQEEKPKDDLTESVNKLDDGKTAKDYTSVDVRKAMHEARLRIEGPDYETNQQGDGYVKYHQLLSKEFVSMAKLLGSDKPSALPAERRAEFINDCDSLIKKGDGTIGRDIPS